MYSQYGKLHSNSSTLSKGNDSSVRGSKYETDLEALQREIDNYTRKMEQEKRRFFSIQQAHKAVLSELEQYQHKLKTAKRQSCSHETAQISARIKNLENNIDTAIATYDGILAHNNRLKSGIDKMRREKKNNRETTVTLAQKVAALEKEILEQEQSCSEKNQKNIECKNYIQTLNNQNEMETQAHMLALNDLQLVYSNEKAMRERQRSNEPIQKAQTVDTYPILKQQLKKIISRNGQKMKFIEQYQRHLSSIEEAFNRIKSITGLAEFEDITNSFIKAEEQNTSLYSYIILLSQNIETLQDSIRFKNDEVKKLRGSKDSLLKSALLQEEEWQKTKQLGQMVEAKQQNLCKFNELLRSVQPILHGTIQKLQKASDISEPEAALENAMFQMDIDPSNVESFLSVIDKHVNRVVEQRYCSGALEGSMTESYFHDMQRIPQPPAVVSEEEKEFMMFNEQDFKRFAEDYLEKRRSNKPRE